MGYIHPLLSFHENADSADLSSPTAHLSHELCIWLIRLVIREHGQLEIPLCFSSNTKRTQLPPLSAVCYGWEGGPRVFVVPLGMLRGVARGDTMQ